jgi:transposase InsO family protein
MRDWCRFSDMDTVFIQLGSPWQNGYSESFNGHFRDEFLSTEQFGTLLEVRSGRRLATEYNTRRPDEALGGSPRRIPETEINQPALSTAGSSTGAQSSGGDSPRTSVRNIL